MKFENIKNVNRTVIYIIFLIITVLFLSLINLIPSFGQAFNAGVIFIFFILIIPGMIAAFYTKGSTWLKIFKLLLSLFGFPFGFPLLVIFDAIYLE